MAEYRPDGRPASFNNRPNAIAVNGVCSCDFATTAFPHNRTGERWERMISVNGADQPSTTQMFWAGYSGMVFLPSTVAPIALAADGLPVGVQIVGPEYAVLSCIAFAQLLEREYYAFTPPPGFS